MHWYSYLQSIKVRDICLQKGEVLWHLRSKGFLRRSFVADKSDDYVLSITGQRFDKLNLLATRNSSAPRLGREDLRPTPRPREAPVTT